MALERRIYESLDTYEQREMAYALGFCFDAGAVAEINLDGTWLAVPYAGGDSDDATGDNAEFAGGLL